MSRPGIMLYFDILESVRQLNRGERGDLFLAVLEYGKYGVLPECKGRVSLVWEMIKPRIDRDEETYQEVLLQRKFALFCRRRGQLELPKIPYEVWKGYDEEQRKYLETNESLSGCCSRYPYTDTNAAVTITADSDRTADSDKNRNRNKKINISINKTKTANTKPDGIPMGASGQLGKAELEAIARLLKED